MIFTRKMKIEIFFISDVRLRRTPVPSLSSFFRPPTPLFTRHPLWMTSKAKQDANLTIQQVNYQVTELFLPIDFFYFKDS